MAGPFGALLAAIKERQMERLAQMTMDKAQRKLEVEKCRALWSPFRKRLHDVIHTNPFEGLCTTVIVANMCLVIVETDDHASGEESPAWVEIATSLCIVYYVVELVAKLYCHQLEFFGDVWNCLDLVIVSFDLCLLVVGLVLDNLPSVSVLRVIRLVRLARAVRAMHAFHELNSLIRSFVGALRALFWGMLMVAMAILIWSILAVQLLHPIIESLVKKNPQVYADCKRCPRSFASVWDASVTWWKLLVTGDSWGSVCEPIITDAPWTCVFFALATVTVNLILLNLILAVIVEAGASSAATCEHKAAISQQVALAKAEEKLIDLCRGLDSDSSGSLTITEFMSGYNSNIEFRKCLHLLNVTEADLSMLFAICDEDDSGEVDYQEFVDQIRRIMHSGQQMVLHYMTQIRHMMLHDKKLRELPVFDMQRSQRTLKRQLGRSTVTSQGTATPRTPKGENIELGRSQPQETIVAVTPIPLRSASTTPPEENAAQLVRASSLNVNSAEVVVADRIGDDKMNSLLRMNEDLVSAMTQVLQESKAQSKLITTLVEDSLAQNQPAKTPQSYIPAVEPKFNNGHPSSSYRGVWCQPMDQAALLPENSGVTPKSGPTVPASSLAPPPSCCARVV